MEKDAVGKEIADSVKAIWDKTEVFATLDIETTKQTYCFLPQPTSLGMNISVENYETELNFIRLNQKELFITIK